MVFRRARTLHTWALLFIQTMDLISYAEAVNKQFGTKIVTTLLANLYGPGDDFRDETSHVIPAIIKKMEEALNTKSNRVTVWGD